MLEYGSRGSEVVIRMADEIIAQKYVPVKSMSSKRKKSRGLRGSKQKIKNKKRFDHFLNRV